MIPTRFLTHVGFILYQRIYWTGECKGRDYHNAMSVGARVYIDQDTEYSADPRDYPDGWPTHCDKCGLEIPAQTAPHQILKRDLYQAPDGGEFTTDTAEPGDLLYVECWKGYGESCPYSWTNCAGYHLYCVLPTGRHWVIDSRAQNCTMPQDKEHRCWVRHGDPENGDVVHVDKLGHTCGAGAGSIAVEGYHGFLHNGSLTDNL